MKKKILLGCFEVPGWGGASTSTYKLFEIMRADGIEVNYVNLIALEDADFFRGLFGDRLGNPKQLPEVWNCFLKEPTYNRHPELEDRIQGISPDIMVGVGWIAALLMKRAAPDRSLIYVTSGCDQMKAYIEKYAIDSLSLFSHDCNSELWPLVSSPLEKQAVSLADYIITHSEMNLFLYRYFFPSFAGKIYPRVVWFTEWIYRNASEYSYLARPFHQRDIDVLFIASNWRRSEKNYPWVKNVVASATDLKIHIVGAAEQEIPQAINHGPMADRHALFSLLGRAKTIACPSLFDAAPGILFEGSALGCNLVASKNCGNWSLCNQSLLADPFSHQVFLDKIRLSLTGPYQDNIHNCLQSGSYSDLLETVLAF
ncbi:MAG: glycosyltransferase family 4 protein [Deltaproteobacteria bacterium]|nr:MAG: glycosyltransferase family 4 protein [Deltaproteobacteria bacterium]